MRSVGPIDVAEDHRVGLHDAVDHARIHREVEDLEVLERVRDRGRKSPRQPMADLGSQFVQGVVRLWKLIWRDQRAVRFDAVDVIRARIRVVVDEARLGVLAHPRRRHIERNVVHVLGRIGRPITAWILEFSAG